MNDYKVIHVIDSPGLRMCMNLRKVIFTEEQNIPQSREQDGKDDIAEHFLLFDNDIPIGVARVIFADQKAIVQRVGVLGKYRGSGLGKTLMRFIIDFCYDRKCFQIELGSQEHAIGFYKTLGFRTVGDKYFDAGIPHAKMELKNSCRTEGRS